MCRIKTRLNSEKSSHSPAPVFNVNGGSNCSYLRWLYMALHVVRLFLYNSLSRPVVLDSISSNYRSVVKKHLLQPQSVRNFEQRIHCVRWLYTSTKPGIIYVKRHVYMYSDWQLRRRVRYLSFDNFDWFCVDDISHNSRRMPKNGYCNDSVQCASIRESKYITDYELFVITDKRGTEKWVDGKTDK